MTNDTIWSWAGSDPSAAEGNLEFKEVAAKAWDEDDVDVKVLYCGLCGSDTTVLSGEFGPVGKDHVGGHEIVGEVVKAGSKAGDVKVGDIVGIGAQCDSCRECEWCKTNDEQYCAKTTMTFGAQFAPYHRDGANGEMARGGFAKFWRGPARYCAKIPDGIDLSTVGPLFCGGLTVYSPLRRHGAGTTRKRVGIIGIGGLGHMAVMLAKAMGAEVTAISRSESKKEEAQKLGADHYIATGDNVAEAVKSHARSVDLIICTINPKDLPISAYMTLLRPTGLFVPLGMIPKPVELSLMPLLASGTGIVGSAIGSQKEMRELLELAAKNNLKPWVQKYNMDDINQCIKDFNAGKPKFRFVLVNTDNGGKM